MRDRQLRDSACSRGQCSQPQDSDYHAEAYREFFVATLETALNRQSCKFAEAVDGAEAVAVFLSFAPDLVLLDINMPIKDGFQAAAEMRAIESSHGRKASRIIAVTALSSEAHRRKGIVECGISEWRTKPVAIKELRDEVEKMKIN